MQIYHQIVFNQNEPVQLSIILWAEMAECQEFAAKYNFMVNMTEYICNSTILEKVENVKS